MGQEPQEAFSVDRAGTPEDLSPAVLGSQLVLLWGGGFTTVSGHFWWRSGHQVVRGLQSLHTTRTCTLYSRMESPDTSSALPHAVTETGLRCGSFSFYFDQTLNFQNMNWFHTTCDPDLLPPTPPLQEENPSPATLPAVPHWRSTRADRRINS